MWVAEKDEIPKIIISTTTMLIVIDLQSFPVNIYIRVRNFNELVKIANC